MPDQRRLRTVEEQLRDRGICPKEEKERAAAAGRPIPTLNDLLEAALAGELQGAGNPPPGAVANDQPKTLDEAMHIIALLRGSAQTRANELAADRVQSAVNDAVATANKTSGAIITDLRDQLTTATGTISTLRAELANSVDVQTLAALRAERDSSLALVEATNKKMRLLEGFNGIRGLSRADAPAAIEEPQAEVSAEQWEARHAAAKTQEEKSEIAGQMLADADRKRAAAASLDR